MARAEAFLLPDSSNHLATIYQRYRQTLIECAMQSCSESTLDMILISPSMSSPFVAICNQRLYLLTQLKKQGLGIRALDSVFNAIVLNKILYALPVYFGYLTEESTQKSQSNGFHILRI